MAAIEILDLEKSYLVGFWRKRAETCVASLRLTIEEGEVFGFLGPERRRARPTLKLLWGWCSEGRNAARILGNGHG